MVVSGLALEALAGFGRSSCDHTNLSTTKEAQKLWNQVLHLLVVMAVVSIVSGNSRCKDWRIERLNGCRGLNTTTTGFKGWKVPPPPAAPEPGTAGGWVSEAPAPPPPAAPELNASAISANGRDQPPRTGAPTTKRDVNFWGASHDACAKMATGHASAWVQP